jgi:hypothetical protein
VLFLERNQMEYWCAEHGVRTDEADAFSVLERIVYAEGRQSGRERAIAEECVRKLGEWSECVLFVRTWGHLAVERRLACLLCCPRCS